MKINLAVSELPQARGLPEGGVQPYHTGIMEMNPFIPDMDMQQAQARAGIAADPAHIELCFPTVHDPSLAPEGKHVITIDVNSQPYDLRHDDWDTIKDARADAAIAQIADVFPKLPDLIEHRQVLSPLDLERLIGLTGGHALHGDMSPDQLLFMRPVRGYADYRTPVPGLYLCGAGTHPGGGVTGANGRNAAREVLRDAHEEGVVGRRFDEGGDPWEGTEMVRADAKRSTAGSSCGWACSAPWRPREGSAWSATWRRGRPPRICRRGSCRNGRWRPAWCRRVPSSRCRQASRTRRSSLFGSAMSDGFLTPPIHDGMGVFPADRTAPTSSSATTSWAMATTSQREP